MKHIARYAFAALFVVGCSAQYDDSGIDQMSGKEDASFERPAGTYESSSRAGFTRLVIEADGTFHREQPSGAIDGSFRFTQSGDYHYIRFYAADGTLIDRYAFEVSNDQISLRMVNTSDWQTMSQAEAWCASVSDCAEQTTYSWPKCIGHFTCASNTCGYSCGAGPSACEAVGGDCVAIAPGTCPSGNWGDPTSCGGGLGVGCCMPADPPACADVGGDCIDYAPDGCSGGSWTENACPGSETFGTSCCLAN